MGVLDLCRVLDLIHDRFYDPEDLTISLGSIMPPYRGGPKKNYLPVDRLLWGAAVTF